MPTLERSRQRLQVQSYHRLHSKILLLKTKSKQIWRSGLTVKNRGHEFKPQHPHQAGHNCLYLKFQEYDMLSCPPWVPAHLWHIHTQRDTDQIHRQRLSYKHAHAHTHTHFSNVLKQIHIRDKISRVKGVLL